MSGRKKVHAVVTPAELSRKIRNRHHFNQGDSDSRQLCQLPGCGAPRSFPRERANVHFVDDLAFQLDTQPV